MLTHLFIVSFRRLWKMLLPLIRRLQTPRWVRSFPYETDKVALANLAQTTKGHLSNPREMVYVLSHVSGKNAVENLQYILKNDGWECNVLPQAGAPGKCIVEARKYDYRLTEEIYVHDCALFNRLAHLYKAEFDGWYAGGKPLFTESTRRRLRWALVAGVVMLAIGLRMFFVWHAIRTINSAQASAASRAAITSKANAAPLQGGTDKLSGIDPQTNLRTLESKDLGATVEFPASWDMTIVQPCTTANHEAGTPECQVQLSLHDWQGSRQPTITLQRITGTVQDVEHNQDAMYATARSRGVDFTVEKTETVVDGRQATKYVENSFGSTKVYVYVQNGNAVFGMVGIWADNDPAGAVYGDVLASTRLHL